MKRDIPQHPKGLIIIFRKLNYL